MHIVGILLLVGLGYVWVCGYYWLPVVLSIPATVLLLANLAGPNGGFVLTQYLIGMMILWAPIWCRKAFGPNVFTTKA